MKTQSDREPDSSQRSLLRVEAISRWDNEGGAGDGGHGRSVTVVSLADALPLKNAELVQLQIRVIALENLLAALLVDASDQQLKLAREMADYITPRPGFTLHRLTIHAAARMISLIERSGHLRMLQSAAASVGDPPHEKAPSPPKFSRTPSRGHTPSGRAGAALSGQVLDTGSSE